MEKTFDSLQKVIKYLELDIEGNGNEMACYSFKELDRLAIRRIFKKGSLLDECYLLVMDGWTSCKLDESFLKNGIKFWTEHGQICLYSFLIRKVDGGFNVRLCPIPKDDE